ncbi:MAG TPA: histidinol dehydrogenase [Acidimicrobiales bacterium]|jgi:histidinol dehydrogenase|nr:histidinol dehydrogenase [Acidimicrobiales bacterium]
MLKVLDLRGVAPTALSERLPRPDLADEGPVADVRAILADVRERGDQALRDYTARFDGALIEDFAVPPEGCAQALARIDGPLRQALTTAAEGITDFHRWRAAGKGPYHRDGITIEHLELPVERAGVYVPGGRARYPSSVLMTAIPPKVAGVGAVVLCTPPDREGNIPDEILAAAELAEVDELYAVGGPQAIAAMAYGTSSIPKVDVIVGAGSRYVSIAKQEVRGVVGVPAAFAGPSEVVVVADDTTPVECAAIDVIVQAEHGPDGLAWLVTWSESALRAVNDAIAAYLDRATRREEIESTLATGGYAVLVDSPAVAMAVANEIAPEHLELCCAEPERLVGLVRHAGAVFLGPYSPASVGDYVAGPSHVLPTFRSARFASVLGVEDFLRRVHVIRADRQALARVAGAVATIARAEGLDAHADSVTVPGRA